MSLLTFLIVKYLLPRFVILYGRRQFVAMVLVAVALKLLCEVLYMFFPFAVLEYRGIGVIVPALIASYCAKQGILVTVGSVLGVTVLVFGIMNLVYFFV